MAGKKAELGVGSVPRTTVMAAFVAVSLITFFLTERVVSTAILQLGVLISYVVLILGVASRRPDAEVLAWLVLGTMTLVCETELMPGLYWLPMTTAVLVVLAADLDHSVAILYPRGKSEAIGADQSASREALLSRRAGRLGVSAAAALLLGFIGTSLAPPLLVPGASAAIVGILGATALALLTAVVWMRRDE